MFCLSLQLLSQTFLILGRNERDIIINVHTSSCKVLAIVARLKLNLNFSNRFTKNNHISNFMTIREAGTEMSNAEGQTGGHDEANVGSSLLCKRALKKM